ncbi:MAG TPA: hypothetical protein VIJ12_09440 [Candidatus Baltobacteraceae bacterium]
MKRSWMTIALAASLTLGACSAPESASQARSDKELAALAPLQTSAQGVITGLDIQNDTTLVVSLDINQWLSIEADEDAALEAQALAKWKGVWAKNHPAQHALLHVDFVDYHATPVYAEKAKV